MENNKKEFLVSELHRWIDEHNNKLPVRNEIKKSDGYPSTYEYFDCFGTKKWNSILEMCGINIDNKTWTDEEIKFLKDNYNVIPEKEIANYLGRTLISVKVKRNKLGLVYYNSPKYTDREKELLISDYLNGMTLKDISIKYNRNLQSLISSLQQWGVHEYKINRWTKEEIKFLKENYKTMSDQDIANTLNRTESGVVSKRSELKLKRDNFCDGKISWTYDKVKNKCLELGYTLLSNEYKNADQKLSLVDNDGYLYYIRAFFIVNGYNARKFYSNNIYTVHNIKLWLVKNNKSFILLSDSYCGANNLLQWKCLKCNETFDMSWDQVIVGQNCPYCSGKKVGLSNCLATKNPELAKEWHPTKNGNLTPYDVTCGTHKKVWWICNLCSEIWNCNISDRTIKHSGCPHCNNSKGELKIRNFLNINNIKYTYQKKYNGLNGIGNGKLSYDFYLPKYNLLIEYQGEQHEISIDYFGGEEALLYRKEHDKRKREYAVTNNIKLLEIWYTDFNNIETILKKELNL